jgi:hypothetical protein
VIRLPAPPYSTAEAITTYCPKCAAMPGHACTRQLGDVGKPTRRPHRERYRHPVHRLQLWLSQHAHILMEIE